MYPWLLFAIAILFLILIPFAPTLIELRLKFLRWLNWNWAANLLESYFQGWVMFLRIVLFVIAALLLYFGWNPGSE